MIENKGIVLMLIMLPSDKLLLLALITRAWIIDFPLMHSDGAESLGKRLMLVFSE